jgi:hypothetical protein
MGALSLLVIFTPHGVKDHALVITSFFFAKGSSLMSQVGSLRLLLTLGFLTQMYLTTAAILAVFAQQ